jgi:hypothetical protein
MSSSDAPAGGGRAEPDAFGFPLQHLTEEARVARLVRRCARSSAWRCADALLNALRRRPQRCDVIAAVREVKPVWRVRLLL